LFNCLASKVKQNKKNKAHLFFLLWYYFCVYIAGVIHAEPVEGTNMLSEIFKWCLDHAPLLAIILMIIGGTAYLTSRYLHWIAKITKSEDDCKKIEQEISPKLTNIQKDLRTLLMYLKSKDSAFDTTLFQSHSPIQLTPFGSDLLEKSGGKSYVDQNLNSLLSEIESRNFRAALDVETHTPIMLITHSSDDSFIGIKNFLYNNPVFKNSAGAEIQLDLSKITQVMGIYLRDKYFEKHPELINEAK
jgi:hypothetical protein